MMSAGYLRSFAGQEAALRGKNVVLILFGAILVMVAFVFSAGMSGGSRHVPGSQPGVGFMKNDTGANDPGATAPTTDGGPLKGTVNDRRVRDELRKRILTAWASQADPEIAAAAKQGRFLPAPAGDGGARMEPSYIQEVMREEFFPMAKKCYEELLSRKDAGGRIEMSFTIVADENHGGIVEDVSVDSDGGVADARMTTCMRESMSSMAFRPPAHGGTVTVVYPIEMSPDVPPDR